MFKSGSCEGATPNPIIIELSFSFRHISFLSISSCKTFHLRSKLKEQKFKKESDYRTRDIEKFLGEGHNTPVSLPICSTFNYFKGMHR